MRLLKDITILLLLLAVLVGILIAVVVRPFTFDQRINVPLPPTVGERLPIELRGTAQAKPLQLEMSADLALSIDELALAEVLPDAEYSILDDTPDDPVIVSMLGRAAFVPASVKLTAAGRMLKISAMLQGEFYVRPRRDYRRDEEQAERGDIRPFLGTVDVTVNDLTVGSDWKIRFAPPVVTFEIDALTKVAWHDAYHPGDAFAQRVQQLIAQRATDFLAQTGIAERDLRPPLISAAQTYDQELIAIEQGLPAWLDWLGSVRQLRIAAIAIDNCPEQIDRGIVTLNLSVQLDFQGEPGDFTRLPELQVRDGPCT